MKCDDPDEGLEAGNIDFRDLLLKATEALLVGGTGNMPYGDVMEMAYGALMDYITDIDTSTGALQINDGIIAPFTEDQSGITGTLTIGKRVNQCYCRF